MLRISHLPGSRDAPVAATFAGRAVGTMLHNLLDAVCGGLAAHREYERLVSMGMRHDPALRVALCQTSHCREASPRRASSLTRSERSKAGGKPLSLAGTA
jgi:hypothetical protein